MEVLRKRIWIARAELLDSIEVRERGRVKWYSYTYRYRGRKGKWRPMIRWDNLQAEPHVDKYDDNGALLEQKPSRELTLSDVERLVTNFRRNLMAMEISNL